MTTIAAVLVDIPPTNRERIADTVYATLRRAIVRRELKPRTHLSVPLLAEQFGVSRSPVREAVQRIVREGLATEQPHRGAFVTEFNAAELEPLYEVRMALDGPRRQPCRARIDKAGLRQIREILEAQAQAVATNDLERHVETDIGFHAALLRAAGNPVLNEMLGHLYDRIRSAMLSRVSPTGPKLALEDHRAIYRAIAAGDGDAAARAAQRHVGRALERLRQARR
jgi:DNA-binding GntR family transcriptional regulator